MEHLDADKNRVVNLLERSFASKDGSNLYLDELADAIMSIGDFSIDKLEDLIIQSTDAIDSYGMVMLEIPLDFLEGKGEEFVVTRILSEAAKIIQICGLLRSSNVNEYVGFSSINKPADIYITTKICEAIYNQIHGISNSGKFNSWTGKIGIQSLHFGINPVSPIQSKRLLKKFVGEYVVEAAKTMEVVRRNVEDPRLFRYGPGGFPEKFVASRMIPGCLNTLNRIAEHVVLGI